MKDQDPSIPPFPPSTLSLSELLREGSDGWFRQVVHGLIGAAATLESFREAFGQRMGISANQYLLMIGAAYLQSPEGPSIAQLAQYIGVAQPHVTTDAGKLVRLGLMEKAPHPSDGRSVLIRLTDEGREAVKGVAMAVRLVNDTLFADITAEEMRVLQGVCGKLNRNAIRAHAELQLLDDAASPAADWK